MSENINERQQKLNDTRAMLDWLEAHPNVPLPFTIDYDGFGIYSMDTKDEAIGLAKEFGSCEKRYADDFLHLTKRFGTTKLSAVFSREKVCERVVVGTEVVPEHVEPAHVRELVEWNCSPLLTEDAG